MVEQETGVPLSEPSGRTKRETGCLKEAIAKRWASQHVPHQNSGETFPWEEMSKYEHHQH